MRDADCVRFLQDVLPSLGYRWAGFRKVRRQVCKRIARRCAELDLENLEDYRALLRTHPEERVRLDNLCRITISRFCRDRWLFQALAETVLPDLARAARDRGAEALRCWSAGCASGEEPYSLVIAWRQAVAARYPGLEFAVIASDLDPVMLRRAEVARYGPGSLRDVPDDWRAAAFVAEGDTYCLRPAYRHGVTLVRQDIRADTPPGPFDLVLCRNLAFTYFDESGQRAVLHRVLGTMRRGAALVVGSHERVPADSDTVVPWDDLRGVYRKL